MFSNACTACIFWERLYLRSQSQGEITARKTSVKHLEFVGVSGTLGETDIIPESSQTELEKFVCCTDVNKLRHDLTRQKFHKESGLPLSSNEGLESLATMPIFTEDARFEGQLSNSRMEESTSSISTHSRPMGGRLTRMEIWNTTGLKVTSFHKS